MLMKFCEHLERMAASCAIRDRSAVKSALLSTRHSDDAIDWRGLEANPQRTSPTPCAHVRCLRRPRRSPWHPRPEIWLRNRSIASPLANSAERSSNVLFGGGGGHGRAAAGGALTAAADLRSSTSLLSAAFSISSRRF